jgi:hypothetical protein
MRRPDETQPEPPGGRAAERLREFLAARFGPGADSPGEADPSGGTPGEEQPVEPRDEAEPTDASDQA